MRSSQQRAMESLVCARGRARARRCRVAMVLDTCTASRYACSTSFVHFAGTGCEHPCF